jgi:hypothetical protein
LQQKKTPILKKNYPGDNMQRNAGPVKIKKRIGQEKNP